jgi:hypothetical protein
MATGNVPNEVLNEMFSSELDTAEGKQKIAALGGEYIRDRLREDSFTRQILPPRQVKRSELQVSVTHDTLVKIVFIEPESRAMTMTFRGQPSTKYYRAARFEVPFHTVGSERYEKTEQELLAYGMPITDIIRRNVVKDIQEVEDFTFLDHVESACQSLQKEANSVAFSAQFSDTTAMTAFNVNAGTAKEIGKIKANDVLFQSAAATAAAGVTESLSTPVQKDDFIKLFKLFPGNGATASRLRCDRFLISDTDFEDINAWTISEVGDQTARETAMNGWKSKTVIGRNYTRTIKTDILRPGNIYAFAAPEFLGGFLIMNKTKFYADKERTRVSFEAWEDISMYLGNVASCRKLELYAGSSDDKSGTANTSVLADFSPVAEEDLGKKNNLVDEGQTFPQVTSF